MSQLIPIEAIHQRIYRIRGQQVMIDSDLAELYQVTTFRLNEQVKRNLKRFPEDFMFRISPLEWDLLTSQIAISKPTRGGRRHAPFAFTEQGIAMLSGVLRSDRAIAVNVAIMRAFVRMRHAILSSRDVSRRVEKLEGKVNVHDTDIRLLIQDVRDLHKNPADSRREFPRVKGFVKE